MFVYKRPWLPLAAAGALALSILLGPVLSGRLVIALLGAIIAGVALALSIRRTDDQESAVPVKNGDHPINATSPAEIFALGKLFEATMNGMREGLLVIDGDMRVVAANQAAHQLFTLYEGKLESQRLTELTRQPAIYNAFLGALKGEERSGVKVETHGPDRRIFDLRVVPLKAGDGKVVQGAIGVFFDITKLERLELVRQEFLSNVSHELRTPLTAILAFVETLEGGSIPEADSQRFLAIIRRNATRMHGLIDDILELSAIEAGNIQVKREEIQLQHIVNDVMTSLNSGAVNHQVVLENQVAGNVKVFADPRRLEQMLTNLIDNAIKFNREGGHVT